MTNIMGDDCVCPSADCCRKDVTVVFVRQTAESAHQRRRNVDDSFREVFPHYLDATVALLVGVLKAVNKSIAELQENLFAPQRSIECWFFCQPEKSVTQWHRNQHARI